MGFIEIITIIFVICKLTGAISCSWWLVFLPEICAIAMYIIMLVFFYQVGKKINDKNKGGN